MSYLGQQLGQGQAERFVFTASGGETSVTTSDDGRAIAYTVGQVDVYLNGAKLINGSDFTATTGTSITGLAALTASDVVEVFALSIFQASDTVSAASGGTFNGNVTVDANLTVTGTVDLNGGNIDGTVIGAAAPAAGSFTTFTSNGIDDNASATAVTLDASGNVGIGTSDPKSTLEVKGTFGAPATSGFASGFIARFSQSSGVGSLDFGFGDPYSWIQSRASNNYATNFDLALNPNGGNVGIGTSSPSHELEVAAVAPILRITDTDTTATSGQELGKLEFYTNDADGTHVGADIACYSDDSLGRVNGMTFSVSKTNFADATEAMRIDSSGNLMVGTQTPQGRMTIVGSAGSSISLALDSNASYGEIQTYNSSPLYLNRQGNDVVVNSGGGSNLLVGTTSAINSTNTIQKSGAGTNALVVNNSSASVPYGIQVRYSATDPNNTSSDFYNAYGGGTTPRFIVRSNGGIANYQANDVNLSDERVKTDITPLGSMWDKFKALEIVTFKYKDQTHDDTNIGVIAQQVEAVAPEFVDNDGFGETPEGEEPLKTIYTADLYHAAIKALQEAMARIETLEAEVAALKGA